MSSNRLLALLLLLLGADAALRLAERWPVAQAADGAPTDQRCRMFNHPLSVDHLIDTTDATSEIGRWATEQRASGWTVAEVDFEVTQKQSGYPAGFVHVCLRR
jgi:hypothetical protein